ncbi:hypothetical protein [Photobacterium sp. OFAV2-7]|uniref:hypothetical protein n=1 Tax=Photobacterium sp. OFAV2-7 TaxID=2917748 RepID=UPI001EF45EC6|nr:hypothetical protein [Photobacterium sp. OFAV2-7]MCG7588724.1 hypothetical protein [Photobacterium sp. OFAV2-7]
MGQNLYLTKIITANDCRALDIACGVIAERNGMNVDMVKGLLMSGTTPTKHNEVMFSRISRDAMRVLKQEV